VSVPESSFISSRIRDALAAIHQRTLELIPGTRALSPMPYADRLSRPNVS
jgi:hypothetical protein